MFVLVRHHVTFKFMMLQGIDQQFRMGLIYYINYILYYILYNIYSSIYTNNTYLHIITLYVYIIQMFFVTQLLYKLN